MPLMIDYAVVGLVARNRNLEKNLALMDPQFDLLMEISNRSPDTNRRFYEFKNGD